MKSLKHIFWAICLMFSGQLQASAWDEQKPFVLSDNPPVGFHLTGSSGSLVLEDPDGSITLEEALKRKDEFRPEKELGKLSYRKHYWTMRKITSNASDEFTFSPFRNQTSNISHLIYPDGSIVSLKPMGFLYDYSHLSDINPSNPSSAKIQNNYSKFKIRPGETLIILSHTQYANGSRFSIFLWDIGRLSEARRFGLFIQGGLLGILLALSIFAWYGFYKAKAKPELIYGVWITSAFFLVLSTVGSDGARLTEFFINLNGQKFEGRMMVSVINSFFNAIQLISYLFFAAAFLQTSKYHPKTHKLIYVFTAAVIVVHSISNFPVTIGTRLTSNDLIPYHLLHLFVFILLFKAAFERYRNGMNVAMFWIIGAIPYLVFRATFVLGFYGVPSIFSYLPESGFKWVIGNFYTAQSFGLALDAIIMSLVIIARNNSIQSELEQSMQSQKTLVENQRTLVENQNKVLEATVAERTQELSAKHAVVVSSVNYASRLQRGQLPRQARIDGRFASFASLWEPRDTIGGDLYWLSSSQPSGPFVLCVADCTGHGVPGAMLSLLVSNSLERIYANNTEQDPASALLDLDHYVRTGLNQDKVDSESDDGCDAAILRIDKDKQSIEFAGAKLGLFQITAQGQVTRHLGTRCSLGYQDVIAEVDRPELKTIQYAAGDTFAIVTDGITDQIGGANGKTSYGYRRLEEMLSAQCTASAQEITQEMSKDFAAWQGANTRRDDVTVVVFRL